MHSALQPAVALAARFLIRGNARSHRLTVAGGKHLRSLGSEPAVLAFWHSQALESLAFVFRELTPRRPVTGMISQSRDGDLAAKIVEQWGLRVHRGSASRGGSRALRGLYRELAKERATPAILVDGPQGPPRVAKAGAVVLAQMTGAPVVPLSFVARRGIKLRSWDRMVWPLPFTTIAAEIGEPMAVPRELPEDLRRGFQQRLGDVLDGLERAARSRLGLPMTNDAAS